MKQIEYNILFNCLPGNIYCKDLNGIIFWHNIQVKQELKKKLGINKLVGKTVNDIFCPKSAKICHEHDLAILNSDPAIIDIKVEQLTLINFEVQNYFTITKPLSNEQGEISGIMVNTININMLKQSFYANSSQVDQNSIFLLKEMLLIINLMKTLSINSDLKLLLQELQTYTKKLFINYNLRFKKNIC